MKQSGERNLSAPHSKELDVILGVKDSHKQVLVFVDVTTSFVLSEVSK
jgi:hypothetical protein